MATPITPSTAPDPGLPGRIPAGLAAGIDLDAVLLRFVLPVVRLAGAHCGAVRVLCDDDARLQRVGDAAPAAVKDRHCGPCGQALDAGSAVWATARGCSSQGCEHLADGPRSHVLAVPLQHRGQALGVFNLFFVDDTPPAPDVQAMLEPAGELLGLALHHARQEQEQLRATVLQERQAMAAEVHDSLAQSLTFMKMRLPLLEDAVTGGDTARASAYCGELRSVVTQAHAAVRGIVSQLRAPMDPLGLQHALAASADAFRRLGTVELEVDNGLQALQLPPEHELQVYHIVQEALANVARHAAARHARLQVRAPADGLLEVVVEDDGRGLSAAAGQASSHYGLQIMRERARRIGASLEIGSRDGGGTRVRLAVPVAAAAARVA